MSLLALGVGTVVFLSWPGIIIASWLSVAAVLSTLLSGFLVARVVEMTKLRRRLQHALKAPKESRPSSNTLQTWPSISMGG